jgi:hypothetical protein
LSKFEHQDDTTDHGALKKNKTPVINESPEEAMSAQIVKPRGQSTNVFINYRREDSSGHAGRLFDALSGHFAGRLFMDVDTLEPGVDFVEAIEQAVGSCEVLIVIIGREWLTIKDAAGQRRLDDPADFVRLEVESALARNVRVIPVLVQDVKMPCAKDLPPSLARLARHNAIELSDERWNYDEERLARTIQGLLEKEHAFTLGPAAAPEMAAPPPVPVVPEVAAKAAAGLQPPPVPAPRRSRSGFLLGIGFAVALAMAVLVAISVAGFKEEAESITVAEEPAITALAETETTTPAPEPVEPLPSTAPATVPDTSADTSAEVTSPLEDRPEEIGRDYTAGAGEEQEAFEVPVGTGDGEGLVEGEEGDDEEAGRPPISI